VIVTANFKPAVKFMGAIEVRSDLTPANGKWKVYQLEYELDSMELHGRWFMTITGAQFGDTVS
jgi:hypothetical protein